MIYFARLDPGPKPKIEQGVSCLAELPRACLLADSFLVVSSLCINQADDQEKSSQVGHMRHIYAKAARVIVWLGEGDEQTHKAIEMLALYAHKKSVTRTIDDDIRRYHLPGLMKLFQSSWWSRIWVYQEVIVASHAPLVVCGNVEISWQDLDLNRLRYDLMRDRAYDSWDRADEGHGPYDSSQLNLLEFAMVPTAYSGHTARQQKMPLTLPRLLMRIAHRHATDPRDKVFAVLGLVRDAHVASLTPDYSQTVNEGYQRATVNFLQSGCKLDLL